ncbi:unnamed protein product [Prorocentrum cordatum]|uniref:Spindle pole body component n=1 Tax=Prorocentrum cordatum TaxID=2364126 RepID=A0ABN9T3C3_9DINO|nr:unnamed protein product [Polarella glacialis]
MPYRVRHLHFCRSLGRSSISFLLRGTAARVEAAGDGSGAERVARRGPHAGPRGWEHVRARAPRGRGRCPRVPLGSPHPRGLELAEFADQAAASRCGVGGSLPEQEAAVAAADLYGLFGGVEGSMADSKYLRENVKIAGADVPLNGGAAWQRLLAEIEVAMRLSHPPPEKLRTLTGAAVRCGGTGVHGHQRWEDISCKLMLSVAYEPLRRRIRYVAARVTWVLKRQKTTICEWMASLTTGPASRQYSPLFAQHLEVLRTCPLVHELVFGAYDSAASIVGENILKCLQGTLIAGCTNPELVLRPATEPAFDATKIVARVPPQSGHGGPARQRVVAETRRRSSRPGVLPAHLHDRVFEPRDTEGSLPFVEVRLRRAFAVLAGTLANQAFAFADTAMSSFCRRHVDVAMCGIDFNPEQRRVLDAQQAEHSARARQAETRFTAVRHCLATLRGAR